MIRFQNNIQREFFFTSLSKKYDSVSFENGNNVVISLKNAQVSIFIPIEKRDSISAKSYIDREMKNKYSAFLI